MKSPILAGIGIVAVAVAVIAFTQIQPAPNQAGTAPAADSKMLVIASFYPLYEFTKNVAGDRAEVVSFTPIGIEPHDWEPSTGDILRLKDARIFIYNGANFEPFVEKLVDSGEYKDVVFVETAVGISLVTGDVRDEHEDHVGYDPHIWLDPILAKQQVATIKSALALADPKNSAYYEKNAAVYSEKLDALDAKIRARIADCKKDTFVPFHNAFTYFAQRYDLNVFPLSGIAPESEATASEIKDFIDFVKKHDIKVIFSEELVDPRLADVLADEAGAKVMVFSPMEGLSEEDIKAGKTYLDKMEENLDNLKVGLECQ
ncbi:MAG: metal ABC transporter substrate-binding protein [Candidatus Nitrosotenuis sp.]|nr:metal ABC transporter substrate-binding protein [Candidatus Nitrosotenuis sp.]